jgi:hypothetical protein
MIDCLVDFYHGDGDCDGSDDGDDDGVGTTIELSPEPRPLAKVSNDG